jgi:hypothetical protein
MEGVYGEEKEVIERAIYFGPSVELLLKLQLQ